MKIMLYFIEIKSIYTLKVLFKRLKKYTERRYLQTTNLTMDVRIQKGVSKINIKNKKI